MLNFGGVVFFFGGVGGGVGMLYLSSPFCCSPIELVVLWVKLKGGVCLVPLGVAQTLGSQWVDNLFISLMKGT